MEQELASLLDGEICTWHQICNRRFSCRTGTQAGQVSQGKCSLSELHTQQILAGKIGTLPDQLEHRSDVRRCNIVRLRRFFVGHLEMESPSVPRGHYKLVRYIQYEMMQTIDVTKSFNYASTILQNYAFSCKMNMTLIKQRMLFTILLSIVPQRLRNPPFLSCL